MGSKFFKKFSNLGATFVVLAEKAMIKAVLIDFVASLAITAVIAFVVVYQF